MRGQRQRGDVYSSVLKDAHSRVSNVVTSEIVVQEESQADISTAIIGDVDQETGHPGGREGSNNSVDLCLETIEVIRRERSDKELQGRQSS